MAFPWLSQETFDDGTRGNFDSETDSSSILDFPDFKELARSGYAPWRGAHAMRAQLSGTAVGFITETGTFDTSGGNTIHVWFTVCIGDDLSMATNDDITLFTLESAGPVQEVTFGITENGGETQFFFGETGSSTTRTLAFTPNRKKWYQVEISATVDSGTANDGTIDGYIDGHQLGAQITSLGQAAISQASLGVVTGPDAGSSGTILFGGIIADDARIYPRKRFPEETAWVTRDQNVFVGPCTIDNASVTGTSTDAVMALYDTDVYSSTGVNFSHEPVVYIRNVTANDQSPGFNTPVEFHKGVYATLTGTNPQGFVSIAKPSSVVMSGANYVDLGKAG